MADTCTWCGNAVERGDGYRAAESPGERRATFCRLEHVVPWFIQGPHWEPGVPEEPSGLTHNGRPSEAARLSPSIEQCAHCGEPLSDVQVLLIRHRGEHRVPDAFCSAEHLAEWAKSGGRWG